MAVRYENWKQVFCEQKTPGTLDLWGEPFTCRRLPKLYNLRMDPYERADITSKLDDPTRLPGGTDASICGAVHRDVQGLPAPPKAIKLQRRPDHGSDVQATGRLRLEVVVLRPREVVAVICAVGFVGGILTAGRFLLGVSAGRVRHCGRRQRYPNRAEANWDNDCARESIPYAAGYPRLTACAGTDA
jgi:hypothetical protein